MTEKSPIFYGLPKKRHHTEVRDAVCKVIDTYCIGDKFTDIELFKSVCKVWSPASNVRLETIMRYLRRYRRREVICINRSKAMYQKVEKAYEYNC